MAFNNGYIGRSPGDSSVVIARQTYQPTGVQTDFTFSANYDVGYLDAYINGARLIEGLDYTATDGSVVGLTTFAQNGDVVELIAYKAFTIADVRQSYGNFTVGANLEVVGNISAGGSVTAPSFYGDLTGDVTGDVTGNVTGDVTGNVTGNVTGTATTAGIATYTSEWILESGNGSDYGISGPGLTGTENDPTFYLTRGQQYKFINNLGAHPFRIQSTPNGSVGAQYNDGITNNDVTNGTLTWNVQFDAPDIVYYQCTVHSNMGGKIYIVDAGVASDVSVNTTGIITATSFSGDGSSVTNVDASTLDSIDSTQFLRSDVADTKTSGDLSFSDSVKATFGADGDLEIYHDGSHSYILDNGTGAIKIKGDDIRVENAAGRNILKGTSTATELYFDNGSSSSKKLETTTTGVTVTGDVNSTSDINLKKDIEVVTSATEMLNQLRGVKFTWKENDEKSLGVIAQEVEVILPELVKGEEGEKSVNYSGLIAVLIESVKELSARVEELEK
jgi:hypothetical protein